MEHSAIAQSEDEMPPFEGSPAALRTLSPDLEPLESPVTTQNVQGGDALDSLSDQNNTEHLSSLLRSMISVRDGCSLAEDEDYEYVGHSGDSEASGSARQPGSTNGSVPLDENGENGSTWKPLALSPKRKVRTVSREGSVLRHPTPDLQTMQGAYVGNVERLEQSAELLERLSLKSNLDKELKKMRAEQKRSDSRRSSILNNSIEEGAAMALASRRPSYGSNASYSILSLNNAARSGGFSPNAYLPSPRSSMRSGSYSHNSVKGRSASHCLRSAQLPEPEKEGKLLEASVSGGSASIIHPSRSAPNVLRVTNEDESSPEIDVRDPQENVLPNLPDLAEPEHSRVIGSLLERSNTNASADTYHQAIGLFADFDGVHITPQTGALEEDIPLDTPEEIDRQTMSNRRLYLGRPQSYAAPPPGENAVYYPAPVPMMLNLPQRLSKLPPNTLKDKRRSQMLSGIPAEARKSAIWLPGVPESEHEGVYAEPGGDRISVQENMANLPPQLRASMFFDYPAVNQDIEIKGGSAMATLDSILDASAHAPVSAFTDHPIAGNLGQEVYGRPQAARRSTVNLTETNTDHRRSSLNLIKRRSTSNVLGEVQKRTNSLLSLSFDRRKSHGSNEDGVGMIAAGNGVVGTGREDLYRRGSQGIQVGELQEHFHDAAGLAGQDEELIDQETPLIGQPTTLLAELQLRKQQQKHRGRTAMTAFPKGMHSTLLELDAVAQVQKQSQRGKHIQLAWEDRNTQQSGAENPDDDDVPLGMLYPGSKFMATQKIGRFDENRPLGLIAKREMEDNEPLSRRRARLKGIPLPRLEDSGKRSITVGLEVPGLTSNGRESFPAEIEGETLAQRLKRFKGRQQNHAPSSNFANEVMSQLGGLPDTVDRPSVTPDPENETLGQRRKRLIAEREAKSRNVSGNSEPSATRPPLTQRRSMADILQAHPAGMALKGLPQSSARHVSGGDGGIHNANHISAVPPHTPEIPQQRASRSYMPRHHSSNSLPMASGLGTPRQLTGRNSYNYSNMMHYGAAFPRVGPSMLAPGQAPMEVDQSQRDMIDRWMESVMH